MRVTRIQAAENRQTVINTASRLFREHGFDGIGLKDLMEGAGLTQGAFYKQFDSKEDLAAQASRRALESASERWSAAIAENPDDPLGAVIAFYLSAGHREEKLDGCPVVALGSDAARQGTGVKAAFEEGIKAYLEVLGPLLPKTDGEDSNRKAMVVLSTMVGAMTLSRAVNDPDLAQAFQNAAVEHVREAAAAKIAPQSTENSA
ncbi:TetR/AcrR family transcriptional regulator [Bradyrhizobium jicamae]|uniref:TetR/AcrR family transcriptional regulator n=1 Tax=Bradyrhizobium jicamae TaxID=280332 RepID=A0ABS5FX07_9BRAD|nr:TetR/AcrR family transcriptional regulator [Bradyrhizobium jicamae]MBR0801250.1 TetR/AcrR family transcriptional regulator [Bradyrhizobium jicamae]MBR0935765.1 TetR/AcrR family transcriptional regulator [Bradyrhizobium jicamae]